MTRQLLLQLVARLMMTLILGSGYAFAGPRVEALGLMKDAAVLRIDGQQKFLRVGEVGPAGVRLLRANSERAVLEHGGQKVTLNLSRQVSARFAEPTLRSLVISRDQQGHYRVQGSINQQPVEFLIDTGATTVGLNAGQARRLGIDYRVIGEPGTVSTASGTATGYSLQLERIKIGEITVRNVRCVVIEGDFPQIALLGMTFLSQVDWQESDGRLVVRSKY